MTQRRKILFLASWYPNREKELEAVFIRRHAEAAALFCDVCVFYVHLGDLGGGGGRETVGGVDTVVSYGIDPARSLGRARKPLMLAEYTALAAATLPGVLWRFGRPDVVHLHHLWPAVMPALAVARLTGAPLVWTEHSSNFDVLVAETPKGAFARHAGRRASAILPVSAALRRRMEEAGIAGRYTVLPNAVEAGPGPLPAAPRRPGPPRLLHVSTIIDSVKNVSGIVRALAIVAGHGRQFACDIVGDGPDRDAIAGLVRGLGLDDGRVIMHRYSPPEIIRAMMRDADLFVLNSFQETFSVVAAEALAEGTPVVATRCGGPEDFVTDDVGRLVPPGDDAALAAAIEQVIDRRASFDPVALSAYAVGRFGYDAVGARLRDVYERVMAR